MAPETTLLSFWILFGGVHVILSSSRVRPRLVGSLGERKFLLAYSTIIVVLFLVMILYFFAHKHSGPLLWSLRDVAVARGLAIVMIGSGFFFLAVGIAPSSSAPTAMSSSGNLAPHGLTRVTRHPGFIGFSLFGLAHCLMNGYLGDIFFFGGFAAWPAIGARDQEKRKLQSAGTEFKHFLAVTSYLPFAAILSGKQRLVLKEVNWKAGLLGLGIFALVLIFHQPLFGP
jgi:uncharacterized membrane protein